MNPLIIQAVSISNLTLNKTTQPLSYNKVTLIDIFNKTIFYTSVLVVIVKTLFYVVQ